MGFLEAFEQRALTLPEAEGLRPTALVLGKGSNALEVAVADSAAKPSAAALRAAWKARLAGRATPLLLVALYSGKAAVCGPAGDHPTVLLDSNPGRVERICST